HRGGGQLRVGPLQRVLLAVPADGAAHRDDLGVTVAQVRPFYRAERDGLDPPAAALGRALHRGDEVAAALGEPRERGGPVGERDDRHAGVLDALQFAGGGGDVRLEEPGRGGGGDRDDDGVGVEVLRVAGGADGEPPAVREAAQLADRRG